MAAGVNSANYEVYRRFFQAARGLLHLFRAETKEKKRPHEVKG